MASWSRLAIFLYPFGIPIVIDAGALGAGLDAKRSQANRDQQQDAKLGRIEAQIRELEGRRDREAPSGKAVVLTRIRPQWPDTRPSLVRRRPGRILARRLLQSAHREA
jgi:hypothetical protein